MSLRPLLLLALCACAPKVPRIPGPLAPVGRGGVPEVARVEAERPRPSAGRYAERIVAAAEHWLEATPRGFRNDCSGFVMAVLDRAGTPIAGNTASFYELAKEQGLLHHRKEPRAGDLAFFDDTYDRDHDGKVDDPLSHIAVVLEVDRDGTILLAHGGTSRGRTTLTMNLRHPTEHEDADGRVINDWLRVKRSGDPPGTGHLAGELWRAFATLDPDVLAQDE